MPRTVLLILMSLGAGLVGGLGGHLLLPPEPATPAPAPPALRAEARLDDLASRVARIEEELTRRVSRSTTPSCA